MKNEVYYLVRDALLIDVSSIIRHCHIQQIMQNETSPKKQRAPSKAQSDTPEYFIESSYDPVTGLYYPMKWSEFHEDKRTTHQSDRVALWNVQIEASSSRPRGGHEESSESEDDGSEEDLALETISEESSSQGNESDEEPVAEELPDDDDRDIGKRQRNKSPTKKRKRIVGSSTITPSKKRRKTTQPTPQSKVAMRARKKFKIRPLSASTQDNNTTLMNMGDDPYLRAMYTLHVGERPDTLPCRDEEYVNIFENVLGLLQETSGGCICKLSSQCQDIYQREDQIFQAYPALERPLLSTL